MASPPRNLKVKIDNKPGLAGSEARIFKAIREAAGQAEMSKVNGTLADVVKTASKKKTVTKVDRSSEDVVVQVTALRSDISTLRGNVNRLLANTRETNDLLMYSLDLVRGVKNQTEKNAEQISSPGFIGSVINGAMMAMGMGSVIKGGIGLAAKGVTAIAKPAAGVAGAVCETGMLGRAASTVSGAIGKTATAAMGGLKAVGAAGMRALDPKLAEAVAKLGSRVVSSGMITKFFSGFLYKKAPALAARVAAKVGVMAAGATVPIAGWIFDLVMAGLLIVDAIELAGYFFDFIKAEAAEAKEPDKPETPLTTAATSTPSGAGTSSGLGTYTPAPTNDVFQTAPDSRMSRKMSALGLSGTGSGNEKGFGQTGSAKEAMDFFTSVGYKPEHAAGIVGNLQAESGASMRTDATGDGGKAYGIAQWHPDRQKTFNDVFGKSIKQANFKEQLAFVDWELNNTEKNAKMALLAAKNEKEAAAIIDKMYERSSGSAIGQRIANATSLMKGDNSTPEDPTNPGTPDATPVATSNAGTSAVAAVPPPSATPGIAASPSETGNVSGRVSGGPGGLPPNVTVASGVDISKVNPDLLARFGQAATEFNRPVEISSGYRSDQKQAELWVRGNILKESGITSPALPATPQTVTLNGQTYHVQGSGRGSMHAQGAAIDSPQATQMAGILGKNGLGQPVPGDPVHIQVQGTPIAGSGGGVSGGAQTPVMQSQRSPQPLFNAGGGLNSMPNGPGGGPMMMPAMNPMLNPGGVARSVTGNNGAPGIINAVRGLASLITGLSGQNQRAPSPQQRYEPQYNDVPSAMPHPEMLRELFDLRVGPGNPAGYAFGR